MTLPDLNSTQKVQTGFLFHWHELKSAGKIAVSNIDFWYNFTYCEGAWRTSNLQQHLNYKEVKNII